MTEPLRVLFEDEHCLAIVKPAGQFVQGTWAPPGESTLEQAVRRHLDPADPGVGLPGDRPSAGPAGLRRPDLGEDAKAARRLSSQFERRQAAKEYWAIVEAADAERPCSAVASDPRTGERKDAGPTG